MPLGYVVDEPYRLVVISGDYSTPNDWDRLMTRLAQDPRIHPGFSFLRDLRGGSVPPEPAVVVAMFDIVRRFWPMMTPRRAAIVTTTDDSAALIAQALAGVHGLRIEVFTSFPDAVDWLTVDASESGRATKGSAGPSAD